MNVWRASERAKHPICQGDRKERRARKRRGRVPSDPLNPPSPDAARWTRGAQWEEAQRREERSEPRTPQHPPPAPAAHGRRENPPLIPSLRHPPPRHPSLCPPHAAPLPLLPSSPGTGNGTAPCAPHSRLTDDLRFTTVCTQSTPRRPITAFPTCISREANRANYRTRAYAHPRAHAHKHMCTCCKRWKGRGVFVMERWRGVEAGGGED